MGKAHRVSVSLSRDDMEVVLMALRAKRLDKEIRNRDRVSVEADELRFIEAKLEAAKSLAPGGRQVYSREDLDKARPWQLFAGARTGLPEGIRGIRWGLFSGFCEHSMLNVVARDMGLRTLKPNVAQTPQRDDDFHQEDLQFDDTDACVAFLRRGGMLLFMPESGVPGNGPYAKELDNSGAVYYKGRFVAVRRV